VTGGFNYFSFSYGGAKRSGKNEIAYVHLSPFIMFMTDQRDLKLGKFSLPFVDVHIVLTEGFKC
jgi:hypothetical protein